MASSLELRELLRWQIEAGADEAIGEVARDRYADSRNARAPAAPVSPPRPKAPPPSPELEAPPPPDWMDEAGPDEAPPAPRPPAPRPAARPAPRPAAPEAALVSARQAGETARALAQAARTVEELRATVESFDGCALKLTANRTVFADGNPRARLMIVGEAPGADEDRQGLPFVGQAGKLLDRMLAAIGLDRTQAYITNVIYWRPPGNRNPTGAETATCLPFLERHVALVDPAVLVLAGGVAAKAVLGTTDGIMRLRGRWFTHQIPGIDLPVPTRAIFHPAFLLRTPAHKREAWRDLLAIRQRLDSQG